MIEFGACTTFLKVDRYLHLQFEKTNVNMSDLEIKCFISGTGCRLRRLVEVGDNEYSTS
jgi:hypothetical protein